MNLKRTCVFCIRETKFNHLINSKVVKAAFNESKLRYNMLTSNFGNVYKVLLQEILNMKHFLASSFLSFIKSYE